MRDIAKQLGVMHSLEGSVQNGGEEVRVIVQLIKAMTDAHLWAETFDRKLTDIFAVESEIAKNNRRQIAGETDRLGSDGNRAKSDGKSGSVSTLSQGQILLEQTHAKDLKMRSIVSAGDRERSELCAGLRRPGRHLRSALRLRRGEPKDSRRRQSRLRGKLWN